MKNLLIFYIIIFVPLFLIIGLRKLEWINETIFIFSFLFYILIYRTYTDGKRLAKKKIIPESSIWKLIIPGTRFTYFKELYLK